MREGWVEDKLSNCIKLKSGNNLTAKNMISGEIPVYGGNGISGYHNDFNLNGENIIIGRVGAWCGNVRYVNERIWLTDNAFKISEYKYDFDYKFLTYMLNRINLRNYARQSAQPVISNSSIKDVVLKFPKSLLEQKQIVKTLNLAFGQIDQAKANLEQNLANAKALFASKLNEVFSQRGEGWEEKTLKDIVKFIDYRGKTPKKTDSGIRLITAKNVKMGILNRNPEEFIAEDDYDDWMTRGIPRKGDVLFTTEAPLAMVALLDTDDKIALAQRIITLCPNREILSGEYLHYCLQSKRLQDDILSKGTGATVTGIKSKLLKEILVMFPNKNIQKNIVNQLDLLKQEIKTLQTHYQQNLNNLEELKKSILEKAFKGELV